MSAARTRLAPDARRAEILSHARTLFGAQTYAVVSASAIARAAGVTPALVSHYFPGGKRDIFLALIADFIDTLPEAIHVDQGGPLRKRVALTIEHWLEWLDANRETWLATDAQGDYIGDAQLRELVDAVRGRSIDTLIADYSDRLTDDGPTRLMLRNWFGFNRACARSWLDGDASYDETALLLGESLLHLIVTVAPALARLHEGP
jgi:AcrR family transcriptional regulator